MEQTVINFKKYNSLKHMLNSSDRSNCELALQIINKSDIRKSFIFILLLMSEGRNLFYTLGTPIMTCRNVNRYIKDHIIEPKIALKQELDLTTALEYYDKHLKLNNISDNLQVRKFFIDNFNPSSFNPNRELKPSKDARKQKR